MLCTTICDLFSVHVHTGIVVTMCTEKSTDSLDIGHTIYAQHDTVSLEKSTGKNSFKRINYRKYHFVHIYYHICNVHVAVKTDCEGFCCCFCLIFCLCVCLLLFFTLFIFHFPLQELCC